MIVDTNGRDYRDGDVDYDGLDRAGRNDGDVVFAPRDWQ
jgi:hypothetical protein